jgi:hypothetical protein
VVDPYARRICLAGQYALVRRQRTTRQLPSDAMRCSFHIADLHSAGPALGIHTAEPEVMLTGTVDLPLKTRREVFRLSTHELSVSIRCIERRIWVESASVSRRYA